MRLRDEEGQSLVFLVLALGVLVAVLALVLDVGNWMRAQRRAQSVADAAALAGAQDLPDQAAAVGTVGSSALQNNWTGTPLQSLFPDSDSIEVVAHDDVSGLFAPVAGLFSITIGAQATARVGVSARLPNVAPIALRCQAPPDCDPWSDGATQQFTFIRNDPTSTLTPVQLPLNGVWNNNAFRTYSACDARNPSPADCNDDPATAPASYLPFDTPPAQVVDAIDGGGSALHLVPIFNGITTGEYDVVGFAVVTFANTTLTGAPPVATVDVTFHRLFLDGRSLPSTPQPVAAKDFGVKAIALTG